MNKIKSVIIFLFFTSIAISCQDKNTHISYYENNNPKERKIFLASNDTTTYFFTSYYPNRKIRLEGFVQNSKKHGDWKEYYIDGALRRNIYYDDNGLIDDLNKKRLLPTLIFDSDSLKVGIKTNIRAINLYSHEILSCKNGIISSYGGKDDLYDFYLIPENTDSISILYYSKDSPQNDTLKLDVSEIKDPAKYGLSQSDIENRESITIVTIHPKIIVLAKMPVYE